MSRPPLTSPHLIPLCRRALEDVVPLLSRWLQRPLSLEGISCLPSLPQGEVKHGLVMLLKGDAAGSLLLELESPTTLKLVQTLVGEGTTPEDPLGKSALEEVANVTASAFANGLAEAVGLHLIPSAPEWVTDAFTAKAPQGGWVLMTFSSPREQFRGRLWFSPDPESWQPWLEACRE